jgi:hypothetical protein
MNIDDAFLLCFLCSTPPIFLTADDRTPTFFTDACTST